MNILDITPSDITRLQENKVVFGLLPERDREIFEFVGTEQCERYSFTGFFRCREGGMFGGIGVYRIRSDYTLPAPTEADIIKYLQASEVSPSQWHPAAQEWAKRHDENGVWEGQLTTGVWTKTVFIKSPVSGAWYQAPHRLRADYGKTKEPETCVWKFKPCYPCKCWQGPHNTMNHFSDECFKFCPDCGKRIETKP